MADLIDNAPAAVQGGPRIDTVGDVTKDLGRRFPKQRDEILAWHDSYFRVLGKLPPDALRKAYHHTIDTWAKAYAPKPADFGRTARETVSTANVGRLRQQQEDRTAAINAERRRLIDDTLRWHAQRIANEARALGVSVGGYQGMVDALTRGAHGLDRRARLHQNDQQPLVYLELTDTHFESARQYIETWRRLADSGRAPMMPIGRARAQKPDAAREERRRDSVRDAELKQLAAEWHQERGDALTERDQQALWDEANASQEAQI